jgi:methyl-accepting chemotaxis protein
MAVFSLLGLQKKETAQSIPDVFYAMLDRTQATIQFKPDGTILTANANFLAALGYTLEEVVGKHHAIFMPPDQVQSAEYKAFWKDLASGKSFTNQYSRIRKDGQVIWIQATYAPCIDPDGKITRIIKVASDITIRQNGLRSIAQGLEAPSQGNLGFRIPHFGLPEVDHLAETYNQSIKQISGVLASVSRASETVGSTAENLDRAFSALSQRTNNQAATLEETTAAIVDLAATVKKTSEGALAVEQSASQAIATAKEGDKVAQDAIAAMSKIEQASSRVSQVTAIIDDIAFQTNLLALNAGVEAARAGEAGRGFAVVAAEVRELAIRSAQAASEIKDLIRDSSNFVKSGVDLVKKAGEELQKTIVSIVTINDRISEIATGTKEQANSLNEIGSTVTELDQLTQQNASMVGASAEAGQTLVAQTNDLFRELSQFRGHASSKDGRTDHAGSPDPHGDAAAFRRVS